MAKKPTEQTRKRLAEGKSLGGAPTKYKPEYCDRLIEFFDREPWEDVEMPHYDEKGNVKWVDFKRMAVKLPTLRDFAKSIEVGVRTVYDWIDEKHASYQREFSQAFSQAQEIRKDFLIQNGLQGLYPPASFKFVAVNVTDMTDKQEVEHKEPFRLILSNGHKSTRASNDRITANRS